jgi:hypothetical protein
VTRFVRVVPVDDAVLADDERVVREFESIYGPLSEHPEIDSKQDVVDAIARANVIDVDSTAGSRSVTLRRLSS